MLQKPKVLLLTRDDREATFLQKTIGDDTHLLHVRSLREMNLRLREEACDVLLCAWSFYQNGWGVVLSGAQGQYPHLPVIVVSRTAGELEWAEVLEAGAFDLLAWPCRKAIALAAVGRAAASRKARRVRLFASEKRAEGQPKANAAYFGRILPEFGRKTCLLPLDAWQRDSNCEGNEDRGQSESHAENHEGAGSIDALPLLWFLLALSPYHEG